MPASRPRRRSAGRSRPRSTVRPPTRPWPSVSTISSCSRSRSERTSTSSRISGKTSPSAGSEAGPDSGPARLIGFRLRQPRRGDPQRGRQLPDLRMNGLDAGRAHAEQLLLGRAEALEGRVLHGEAQDLLFKLDRAFDYGRSQELTHGPDHRIVEIDAGIAELVVSFFDERLDRAVKPGGGRRI